MEISNDLPDDGNLLGVLLAKVCDVRMDDVEQLQTDGSDAVEVTGAEQSLESNGGSPHLNGGRISWRIDFFHRRDEHRIDSCRRRNLQVPCLVTRICGEVGQLVELAGIDEDGSDHVTAFGPRRGEQGDMPLMQCAHRWHEADEAPARQRPRVVADLSDRSKPLHGRVWSARARYMRSSSGACWRIAARCASMVCQSPRAIGPVSSNPFSMVRCISGIRAAGGAPAVCSSREAARYNVTRYFEAI